MVVIDRKLRAPLVHALFTSESPDDVKAADSTPAAERDGDLTSMMARDELPACFADSLAIQETSRAATPSIEYNDGDIECWRHKKIGEIMRMRLAQPKDKPLVLDAFSRLSADSIMKRFFGIKSELTEADLKDFTDPAPDDYSIVVTVPSDATPQGERIVGIGQFFRLRSKPSEAEVAFLVIDEYQHQGLATRLLKQLLRTGYARGIETFTADTLLTNFGMQALVTHHVEGVRTIRDGTEVTLIIPVRNPDEHAGDYAKLSPLLTRRNTIKEDPPTFRRVSGESLGVPPAQAPGLTSA